MMVPDDFPNQISLRGTPDSARDLTAFAFSDLGAWHMFGLPGEGSSVPGSFPGPFLLQEGGVWLSPWLIRPTVEVDGVSEGLEFDPGVHQPTVYLPGRLHQALVAESLKVEVDLIFASSSSNLVRARALNRGPDPLTIRGGWAGGGPFLPVDQTLTQGEVRWSLPGSETTVRIHMPEGGMPLEVGRSPTAMYRIPGVETTIAPGGAFSWYATVAVGSELETSSAFPLDPEEVFSVTEARWSRYLSAALGSISEDRRSPAAPGDTESGGAPWSPTPAERIGAKAVQTLISNWRVPRGHLLHSGLFPSYAYRGFHGVWSWDSWKHARALALFQPDLAKDQIRVMLDFQNPRGMVPDVIYADSTENNWRDTKPPLAAWAVDGIFQETADTAFVREVLPALVAYHSWWYRDRDHDGNGLCEYGSTDGTRIAAAWESGMDNAVRFDDAGMVQNGPEAWSLTQESVDLNAYLFAEKRFLADLSELVGQVEEAGRFRQDAEDLGEKIRTLMFDAEVGFFFDVDLETKTHIRVQGPEGWIPLWAGVAGPEQAEAVRRVMTNPSKFFGLIPFPTLAMDHPEFDPLNGYWRGPVWLDQAYFAVVGLERYGFWEDAAAARSSLLTSPQGLTGDAPIFENYHPVSGEGLNAPHFSWSAAHLLLLMENRR